MNLLEANILIKKQVKNISLKEKNKIKNQKFKNQKYHMTQLKPFGYQSGDVETFLKGFGYDLEKETPAEFCKRHWNVTIDSEDKPKTKRVRTLKK
jgi:hypothetical protein